MNKKTKNEELGRINVEEFKNAAKAPLIVILDDIRSLNNIGSIFRTSDAYRVKEILLCGITAQPPHRDIQKTALGATDSVSWRYFEEVMDAITDVKSQNFKILALEQAINSTPLNEFKPNLNSKYAIVVGNEVRGVSQEVVDISDTCLEIPQFGTKHSFNVSVSTGITLWDIVGKMDLISSL